MNQLTDNTNNEHKTFGYVKRGMKTVRSRATEFIDTLRIQHIKELPLEQAQENFSLITDEWDRTTLKAYFGVVPHKSKRKIDRFARYQSGTVSLKVITLSEDIPYKKGYLEKLGLIHYEGRGKPNEPKTWFMILSEPENTQIIPEIVKVQAINESIPNLSLSLSSSFTHSNVEGLGRETNLPRDRLQAGVGCPSTIDIDGEKRERDHRGRERNQSSESEQNIEPELQALANAQPLDSEPDRGRIQWPDAPPVKWKPDSNGS